MKGEPKPALLGVSLKLYFGHNETLQWCREVADMAKRHPALQEGDVKLFVLPSFQALVPANQIFADTPVLIGAQNLHWQNKGAYTGEVSGAALRETGCRYVEVGHAERRRIFGEDDTVVAAKAHAALQNGLIPVLCVGEIEEAPVEAAAAACIGQLRSALSLETGKSTGAVVVAYEPVWAIGASNPASAEHITGVCALIREWLSIQNQFDDWSVIYGGSAGPGLMTQLGPGVDGLFLGRFAHDVDALSSIIGEAARPAKITRTA
ncbi:triosephosphate isomerase [Arthrobacter sp. Leaf337]|uniref:triose-phosphate isomerase family protein n=1 Tax=Arthrobacter sp. Leaf337 TaxID=1736342 RepID=UPI0006FE734B|nr:triose-phosphate isomerase family protein [Arthrobacter sp. Leaf337]KQR64033.1 triosephosphate isomerase [Arthrobacter sp. Leaf337]